MANEKMDVTKLYEWVIVESRQGMKNGATTHIIKSLCTTEPTRITESFHCADNLSCKVINDRMASLGLTHEHPPNLCLTFRVGNKFWAKVQPTLDSDGTVRWMFSPYSFTMQGMGKVPNKAGVDEVVSKTIMDKVPYQDALKLLSSQGSEYVKEYRKRMSQVGVKQ